MTTGIDIPSRIITKADEYINLNTVSELMCKGFISGGLFHYRLMQVMPMIDYHQLWRCQNWYEYEKLCRAIPVGLKYETR